MTILKLNVDSSPLGPANSNGIWEIRKTTRKVFMVFDEAVA